MNSAKYSFVPGEAGTLVEIYLPTVYHSVLLNILKRGLNHQHVIESFPKQLLDDCPVSTQLRRLLPNHLQIHYEDILPKLTASRGVCFGFSVFNVDGTFANASSQPDSVVREQVTVARIIVRPDFPTLYPDHNIDPSKGHQLVRWFFNSGLRAERVLQNMPWLGEERISEDEKRLIDKLGEWQNYSALFLYGYIIRRITEIPEINEEEIWVTSYHNPVVNVIRLMQS